ncbi:CAH14 anhydrase, partial [Rhinopomastus cyanomelas]|nr:CAH14 anhydrase [Rhinopomastus cyanomelas]
GPHGQQHWPQEHPECGGRSQSPIDIPTERAQPDPSLPPVQPVGYQHPETETFTLANNGHTAVLALPASLRLRGFPCGLAAAQLHFHWGRPGHSRGAEHLLDGHRAPAEVRGTPSPGGNPRGTCSGNGEWGGDGGAAEIMGWGMGPGGPQNVPLIPVSPPPTGQTTVIPAFSIRELLPDRLDLFYRYNGSLTTPPCFQGVLWTLFQQPVHISQDQLEQLQGSLYSTEAAESDPKLLVDNFREPQELNQRLVLVS